MKATINESKGIIQSFYHLKKETVLCTYTYYLFWQVVLNETLIQNFYKMFSCAVYWWCNVIVWAVITYLLPCLGEHIFFFLWPLKSYGNSGCQFTISDFYSVKPSLAINILLVWIGRYQTNRGSFMVNTHFHSFQLCF